MSDAFLGHLSGEVTTLCNCWRVSRADGVVMGFTDHDRPLAVDGTLFEPESGLSASEARKVEGLGIPTIEVAGALAADSITEADILDGRYDGAAVEALLVNWAQPSQFALTARAVVAKITRSDGRFVAELEGPARGLDAVRGRTLGRHCDARLGDARCTVNLADPAYAGAGTVVAVEGADGVTASGLAGFAPGWFAGGVISWTGGGKAGRSERVASSRHAGGLTALTYWSGTATRPQPGDTFTIVAGCDRSFATCKAKFANQLNFRGFPHLPGNDQAYSYVTEDGVFDGTPLVP
jgi:uncharacterized phage protein (TIGR02218 family)